MKTWIVIYFGKVVGMAKISAKLTPFEVERELVSVLGYPKNALFVPDRRQN